MRARDRLRRPGLAPEERSEKRYPIVLEMVGSENDVLDLGCGSGLLATLMAEMGNRVTGVDVSGTALEGAASRGVTTVNSDLEEDLPFQDGAYDIVVCSEVLEHLFNPRGLLDEARRVLRPGGHLVITTPNIAYVVRRICLLLGWFPEDVEWARTSNTDEWEHIRFFTLRSIKRLLDHAGFEPVAVRGVDRFPWLPLSSLSTSLFAQGFVIKAVKRGTAASVGRRED